MVRQCKAITGLGNRCNNPASPGSLSCSIAKHIEIVEKDHRILQWGIRSWCRIPSWLKITAGSVSLIIGIFAIFQTCYYGEKSPSKSDLKGTEERVIKGQQDSKQEIINVLTKAEKINRDRLEREYPYGYVLLHVDTEQLKQVKREATDLPDQRFEIDWSKSRVTRLGKKGVEILLPDMVVPTPKGRTKFSENIIMIKRTESIKKWSGITLDGVTFWTEVLINEENLLALVIGFGPKI